MTAQEAKTRWEIRFLRDETWEAYDTFSHTREHAWKTRNALAELHPTFTWKVVRVDTTYTVEENPTSQIPDLLHNVGPGWHPLLTSLHEQLVAIRPYYEAGDVKEKYGTLRVYLANSSPHLETLVDWAETESASICEDCGQPGELRYEDRHWVKTLCEEHK